MQAFKFIVIFAAIIYLVRYASEIYNESLEEQTETHMKWDDVRKHFNYTKEK